MKKAGILPTVGIAVLSLTAGAKKTLAQEAAYALERSPDIDTVLVREFGQKAEETVSQKSHQNLEKYIKSTSAAEEHQAQKAAISDDDLLGGTTEKVSKQEAPSSSSPKENVVHSDKKSHAEIDNSGFLNKISSAFDYAGDCVAGLIRGCGNLIKSIGEIPAAFVNMIHLVKNPGKTVIDDLGTKQYDELSRGVVHGIAKTSKESGTQEDIATTINNVMKITKEDMRTNRENYIGLIEDISEMSIERLEELPPEKTDELLDHLMKIANKDKVRKFVNDIIEAPGAKEAIQEVEEAQAQGGNRTFVVKIRPDGIMLSTKEGAPSNSGPGNKLAAKIVRGSLKAPVEVEGVTVSGTLF